MIGYKSNIYEFSKGGDCLVASCMTHLGVLSFLPLYLSNCGQQYNAKLLVP